MALRIRRGTDAERGTVTPLSGELIYTTDTKTLYVGDGTTVGGTLVGPAAASAFNVVNDTSPQLGGDLDLNGSDIIGTGNINITGTITATGSINLGDGAEDNIIVGGVITSSLVPGTSDAYDLGSAANRWRQLHVNGVAVDGHVEALSVNADLVDDSSVVSFNAATGEFTGNLVGNVTGDIRGSVFADDSSTIVDSVSGTVSGIFVGEIQSENNAIFNLNQATLTTNNGLEFNMLRGTIAAPTEPNDFDRTNIIWNSYDGVNDFRNDAIVVGYHQSGGGGYIAISAADPSYALFNTYIGLDGKTGVIEAVGSMTVSNGITADVTGSLFSDASTMLIDGTDGKLLAANINVVGSVAGTPSVGAGDLANVNEWLQVTVNGATRYIPLYA